MKKNYPVSKLISIPVILIGLCVLCGWAFEIDILKSFVPDSIPMRVNTAFCFVLSGVALWLTGGSSSVSARSKIVVILLASVVFLFAFLSQVQYVFKVDLGIDLLIMGKKSLAKPGGILPGRMSAIPTFNFELVAIIFFLKCLKPAMFNIYRVLASVVLLISLFALSVHVYHTASYVENPDFTSLALGTAVNFIFLSVGILLVYPNKGIIGVFTGQGFTGVIAWQILPFVIIIPLVMGIVWLEGEKAGWNLSQSGTMFFALMFLAVLLLIVAGNIVYILRMEKKFKVHEQSAYLASIVNFSDDAIISKSLEGTIQSWNKGAEKIFGYSSDEAVGKPVSIIIPEELIDEERENIEKITKGQIVDHFETKRKRKDGSVIFIALTISPLHSQTGNIIGASVIARDISERKLREVEQMNQTLYVNQRINEIVDALLKFTNMDFSQKISVSDKGDELDAIAVGINSLYEELEDYILQIRESSEQIQTVFRNAPDAIIVIDEEGKILQWNPKAEMIFGWNADEVSGKYLHEFIIPADYREGHRQGVKHFLTTGESHIVNKSVEMPAMRKDGNLFDAELSISHSVIRGKHFFIGFVNDITMRKQVEETRKRYIEQVAQNKELESFAYIVSHDLKTPMQGIAKIADWLNNDYSDKLDSTGREYLQLLKNRVVKLESLVNGILAYSRAGNVAEEKKQIDFNELVEEIKEILSVPETVSIKVVNQLPVLTVSKTALIQVLGNLIGNAIKHNNNKLAEIEIGSSEEKTEWKFFVKDNGPGIGKQDYEKIFRIFYTLKHDNSNNSTGIGLGIVKKIVEKEGGRVWVESELGKGSCFIFTISKMV